MLKKIKPKYDWSYFLPPNQDYSVHKGTCLAHQLDELTDIHEEYGLGETYTSENTVIRQLWYDNTMVDFEDLGKQLNMEVITVSSILQPPGNIPVILLLYIEIPSFKLIKDFRTIRD